MQLDVDEPVHSIFLREAPDETLLVLPNSLCWIAGDAGVQRAVSLACENVYARLSFHV